MKYFINYANNGFQQGQQLALDAAKSFGFEVKGYSVSDLDSDFVQKNNKILSISRGAGYWIWKPYIILDMLSKMQDGDYLMYMDSGARLHKDPDLLFKMINHKGIITFSLGIAIQSQFTKGDAFFKVCKDGDFNQFKDSKHMLASFLILKKCDYSVWFINEWLRYCLDEDIVTDKDNIYQENCTNFIENRHDQTVLSLLTYKHDIMYLPDICQWNFECGLGEEFRFVDHHRRKV
jgi:hypothetical protein